ncbi:hypothetical protein C2W64_00916 [Brevibacillus laterosporus]|nr:hypothetical protein C2W64_00916 [Brevibacillus laterosporus]
MIFFIDSQNNHTMTCKRYQRAENWLLPALVHFFAIFHAFLIIFEVTALKSLS